MTRVPARAAGRGRTHGERVRAGTARNASEAVRYQPADGLCRAPGRGAHRSRNGRLMLGGPPRFGSRRITAFRSNYSPVGARVRNGTDPYLLSASDDASQAKAFAPSMLDNLTTRFDDAKFTKRYSGHGHYRRPAPDHSPVRTPGVGPGSAPR